MIVMNVILGVFACSEMAEGADDREGVLLDGSDGPPAGECLVLAGREATKLHVSLQISATRLLPPLGFWGVVPCTLEGSG